MTATPEVNDEVPRKEIETALKGSGFPFQTAVRDKIQTFGCGYKIHASEYPWSNSKNEDGFLDLVATNSRLVLTIECKKTRQEKYIFLLPLGAEETDNVAQFRCPRVARYDSGVIPVAYCENRELKPMCSSSEFCVVSKNSNERMLERDAALLVNATDAFTTDHNESRKLGIETPYLDERLAIREVL